ncbi:phosphodiesterase [Erysipelothrix sp. strain 2 (EsS2-7-Brazil)]|uniref:phosphodiesterase n=1 Tax=Erysipelothrix sp. strain 2 (EsS2-7-Brazil) TaxID=2500579 RepID=UPI00190A23CE|nr:phosphodiesterase [Erysipelothrix sp. strain 2 (EsS2-7-Brazil)]MBK2403784.1 phosphodiesterase [Erysipelothrix sp. strain 2 (EsS2-7-Brazil)]
MKTLIISDIHGSIDRLNDVLNTPLPYDRILLVGDLMYHGPRNPILADYNPKAVSDRLNQLTCPIIAVRGNCDSEVDQMLCQFSIMQDYTVTEWNNLTIMVTHGHLFEPDIEGPRRGVDLFISGHTHVPFLKKIDHTTIYNPGSIALPKENHPNTYGYLDDRVLTTYTLNHDVYMQAVID